MSKYLLTEYYELCPNGLCEDLLTEAEKQMVKEGSMFLTGVMQRAEAKNGNGRRYPRPVLEREDVVKEGDVRACHESVLRTPKVPSRLVACLAEVNARHRARLQLALPPRHDH